MIEDHGSPRRPRYRFEEVLGQGAFGCVYRTRLSERDGMQSIVAVKIVTGGGEQGIKRLRDEGRLLRQLRHENVVKCQAIEPFNTVGWGIVLDYVDGADLERLLRAGATPSAVALAIGHTVASTLAYVHAARDVTTSVPLGLIHRDLKPSNLMVTPSGAVRLLDFGAAHARFDAREAVTRDFGPHTPGYMAPERLLKENVQASDVFSLGLIMCHCALGVRVEQFDMWPERFAVEVDALMAQLDGLGLPLDLLRAMLAYEHSDRPSAEAVAERLRAYGSTDAIARWAQALITPGPSTPGPLTGQTLRPTEPGEGTEDALETNPGPVKRRQWVGLAVFGVTVFVAAGLAYWALSDSGRSPHWFMRPPGGWCSMLPKTNAWNTDISQHEVHRNSDDYIDAIGRHQPLNVLTNEHAPVIVTEGRDTAWTPIHFDEWQDEQDQGDYPIPRIAIENTQYAPAERHTIAIDWRRCVLHELWELKPDVKDGRWEYQAKSGARFDLRSNALRPEGSTSADGAGLPVYPGLLRRDEVEGGTISHALRVSSLKSQYAYIHPATHRGNRPKQGENQDGLPPRGLRLRMKKTYDCSMLHAEVQVICRALKRYGLLLADNNDNWRLSGLNEPWPQDVLDDLAKIPGDAFEAVETGPIIK